MNALAASSSPYLRQHADNPVAWLPWSAEAFAEARRRDVPVLVSIGYATCHWCHVMAHESFEDPDTAALMNRGLVCIKVDREEHPEVDHIYMDAVQALTGHGGWPLNAFCDHDGRPFHAMTYAPRPQWQRVCTHLARLWQEDRPRVLGAAAEITAALEGSPAGTAAMPEDLLERLHGQLARAFDHDNPGWAWNRERAPKFPAHQVLALAIDDPDLSGHAIATLEAMQDSGIHDRVGGGFHRYSVDAGWRLPHFEKMLYDNAQLMAVYARCGVHCGREDFLATAIATGDYLLRDLWLPEAGALATAEDADDAGGEGSFYAWSREQLCAALGEGEGARLAETWNVAGIEAAPAHGDHHEPVVPWIPHPRGRGAVTTADRLLERPHLGRLRAIRGQRPRPIRDDKVLTDQNALAAEGFAWLHRMTGTVEYAEKTAQLCAFIARRHGPGGLLRLPGREAYITDYGAALCAFIAAFDALGDPRLIDQAVAVADEAVTRLRAEDGGFWTTAAGRGDLIRRCQEHGDNAWPGGEAQLALGFVGLHQRTGEQRWATLAEGIFHAAAAAVANGPAGAVTMVRAWRLHRRGALTVVVCGDPEHPLTRDLLTAARRCPADGVAIIPAARCADRHWTCLDGRRELSEPQALVCRHGACLLPARDGAALTAALNSAL